MFPAQELFLEECHVSNSRIVFLSSVMFPTQELFSAKTDHPIPMKISSLWISKQILNHIASCMLLLFETANHNLNILRFVII